MVRTLHSATAAVLDVLGVLDVELEVEDDELSVGAELDVVSGLGVVVVTAVVVDEEGDVDVVVSTEVEVTREGATAIGLSPT
jgi:hypothetical protein